MKKGLWRSHAAQWDLIGPPLRPSPEDVAATTREVAAWAPQDGSILIQGSRGPRAVVLGVTPELARLPWPEGTTLFAADRSEAMIEEVWPKEGLPIGARAWCADWRALPFQDGSIDIAVGDGCLTVLAFPSDCRSFFAEIRRVLAPGGRLILRLFASPETPENLSHVADDLWAGRIGSFHVLKWRIAMAVQQWPRSAGVRVADILSAFEAMVPVPEQLTERFGWDLPTIQTICAYRDQDTSYSFPPLSAVREEARSWFPDTRASFPTYELGERCPTLLFQCG